MHTQLHARCRQARRTPFCPIDTAANQLKTLTPTLVGTFSRPPFAHPTRTQKIQNLVLLHTDVQEREKVTVFPVSHLALCSAPNPNRVLRVAGLPPLTPSTPPCPCGVPHSCEFSEPCDCRVTWNEQLARFQLAQWFDPHRPYQKSR